MNAKDNFSVFIILSVVIYLLYLSIFKIKTELLAWCFYWLTIALRVFTLIEFVVREALQKAQRVLPGLYDGNPKRATARPSTEQLLKTFSNLTLYILPDSTIFDYASFWSSTTDSFTDEIARVSLSTTSLTVQDLIPSSISKMTERTVYTLTILILQEFQENKK